MHSLDELRKALDLRGVINFLTGIRVYSRKICCPFHNERTPSFSVYRLNGVDKFKCWGGSCGVRGDVLEFIKLHEGFTQQKEVLDWLQDHRSELELDQLNIAALLAELTSEQAVNGFWSRLEKDCRELLFHPLHGTDVRDWLTGRGVDGRAHKKLPLGCFDFDVLMNEKGYTPEEFKKHGISGSKKAYPGPIATFFYYSTPTSLSRIKLRLLGDKKDHRVIGSEIGGPFGFFGLDLLDSAHIDELTWVEGEIDLAVPQSQSLVQNNETLGILCSSGSGMASTSAAKNLAQLGTRQLNLWPDNDESGAGQKLVWDILRHHQRPGLYINVLWPPDYKIPRDADGIDPADYCQAKGSVTAVAGSLQKGVFYAADWLADEACRGFLAHPAPDTKDLVSLQERLLEICDSCRLIGTTLANFLKRACDSVPSLHFESLYHCAMGGRPSESPEKGSMGGMTYRKTERGYYTETVKKDGSIADKQISNFRLDAHKLVEVDDPLKGACNTKRNFHEGLLVRAGRSRPIRLSDTQLRTWQSFKEAIMASDPQAIMDAPTFQTRYWEIFQLMNQSVPSVRGTIMVGQTYDPELQNAYVTPNWYVRDGKVYENTDIPVVLDTYRPSVLSRKVKTPLVQDQQVLEQAANLLGKVIPSLYQKKILPLAIIGQIAASPLVDMLGVPKGILYLEGPPGAGKTVTTQLLMNMAWDYPLDDSNLNFASTINYLEMVLMFFRGLPVYIDDAKAEMLKKTRSQVLRMIQSYYDRQGRGRLNRNLDAAGGARINGHLIISGESLPIMEESALSRMVVLTFPKKNNMDKDEVLKVVKLRQKLNSLWPYYIAWLQRQSLLKINDYATGVDGRLKRFVDTIGTGLELYMTFLHEEYGLEMENVKRHMRNYVRGSKDLVEKNTTIRESLNDGTLFIDTLAEMIMSNPGLVNADNGLAQEKLGVREGDTLYIYPHIAIRRVSQMLDNRAFVRHALEERLTEGGYLLLPTATSTKDTDKTTVYKRMDGGKRRHVWPLDAKRIFGDVSEALRGDELI
jgi:hypothetical protein